MPSAIHLIPELLQAFQSTTPSLASDFGVLNKTHRLAHTTWNQKHGTDAQSRSPNGATPSSSKLPALERKRPATCPTKSGQNSTLRLHALLNNLIQVLTEDAGNMQRTCRNNCMIAVLKGAGNQKPGAHSAIATRCLLQFWLHVAVPSILQGMLCNLRSLLQLLSLPGLEDLGKFKPPCPAVFQQWRSKAVITCRVFSSTIV